MYGITIYRQVKVVRKALRKHQSPNKRKQNATALRASAGVMSNLMKNILFLSLTLFCSAAFAENKSVTVFDGEFKKINELTQPKDIEAFYSLWQTKVASDKKIRMDWSKGFKLVAMILGVGCIVADGQCH